jgi:hypothetical protein
MPSHPLGIKITLPEGLILKEGDEADLRVVIKDGDIVVTKVLRQTSTDANAPAFKASLGSWNRK